jgi:hypothetical protein
MKSEELTIGVRIRDMDWFREYKDIVIRMIDDERISEDIRKEYRKEMMSLLDRYADAE